MLKRKEPLQISPERYCGTNYMQDTPERQCAANGDQRSLFTSPAQVTGPSIHAIQNVPTRAITLIYLYFM